MSQTGSESSGLAITAKSNSFQLYEFNYSDLRTLTKYLESREHQCDLEQERPGFLNTFHAADGVAVSFREILTKELDVLEDGRVQTQKYVIVEEGHLVIYDDLIISFGNNVAVKSAMTMLMKFTKVEPKPVFINPERIFKISDQMAFIQTMDFDKMEHPTIKKLRFDGKIESLADIAPFHNYTANIKSVKGVITTPFGIRTVKLSATGKISVSRKKEEDLDSDIFRWIFKNLIKAK